MKPIRLGAYGDPFAIPPQVFKDLFNISEDEYLFHMVAPKKDRHGKPFLGYVLYEGISHLGPDPIVVIVTGLSVSTVNSKTGDLAQIWIMLRDIPPQDAGPKSKSVCGNCAFRHDKKGGLCYVRLYEAPLSIFNAYHKDRYSRDPNGIKLVRNWIYHRGHTGYSESAIRFLNHKDLSSHAEFVGSRVMLSAKTAKEAKRLNAMGFKTFRPVNSLDELERFEDLCASDRLGLTCDECMQCHGVKSKSSHAVLVHGAKKNNLIKIGGKA